MQRQHDSITAVLDAVMKLLRCAGENKMKAELKDGCVPIHECCDGPCLTV